MVDLLLIFGYMVAGGVVAFICAEIEWRLAGKPRSTEQT